MRPLGITDSSIRLPARTGRRPAQTAAINVPIVGRPGTGPAKRLPQGRIAVAEAGRIDEEKADIGNANEWPDDSKLLNNWLAHSAITQATQISHLLFLPHVSGRSNGSQSHTWDYE
jgi:hypothetical protein